MRISDWSSDVCSSDLAAYGAPMLPRLYIPERSKQQARRMPEASLSQAVSMRLTRVSAFLPEMIQAIQSRRATGVMSVHVAFAARVAAGAFRRAGLKRVVEGKRVSVRVELRGAR